MAGSAISNGRRVDARRFVREEPSPLRQEGRALLDKKDFLEGAVPGSPLVSGFGTEIKDPPPPIRNGEPFCDVYARGVVLIPKKGVIPKLAAAMDDPGRHPEILVGVETSKNIGTRLTRNDSEIYRVVNHQSGARIQYFSEITARHVSNGITYTQHQLYLEKTSRYYRYRMDEEEKKSDRLYRFVAGIQFLEIARGTVVIMEMGAVVMRPSMFVDCQTVADSDTALLPIPDFLGADEAVVQTMRARLIKFYEAAMR